MKKLALFLLAPIFVIALMGFSGNTNPDDGNLNTNNTNVEYKSHLVPFHTEIDYWGPPPGVGEDGMVYIDAYGTGNATHMGLTDMVIHEIVDTKGLCSCEWNAEADVILTAANGDELNFSYTSSIDASDFLVSGELIIVGSCNITGGTGRFVSATGTLTYNGTHNVFSSTGTVIFDGTIMY